MNHDHAHRPDPTQGNNTPDNGARIGTYFLGRYRVVDEIGIGGMASVHLGRMDGPGGFQKWVAIKRIHPHLIEDDSFVQMFLDEARVAARISHPNVATVFELGKHDDSYWIAMEYLHGEPLRELMRRTEEIGSVMPPEIACRIIADAAEGLHAAHELTGKNGERLNLVHRDVTPHNLFVSYDGTTKVVDFGIAKFASRMSQTRAGTLKGKLAYMSPEQVHGEQIDRRTDIFALGVVLWELTTGQRLFRMESDLDTLAKVQECNVPRPSTLVRGYPIDLEKIVMKALSKNRGERFKTAREFSRALQGLLMRRGLFIASDEVAGYVQSIFQERIQKRDAHLRWAAEVTQTINIDRPAIGLAGSREQSISAENPQRQEVRPAAGARPQQHQPVDAPPNTMPMNESRHSPTVRPPSRADYGGGTHPADSGPYPTLNEEEFDDSDATIVTNAPRDLPGLPGNPPPAAGRSALGDSGETQAMQQQQQQQLAQQRAASPFAATMDARQTQGQLAASPEFHPLPGNQPTSGLGMNLMGSRNAPNMGLGETLPMNPFHQTPQGSSPNLGGLFPNAPVSSPMIRLAPLEFGGSMDNRTVTAQAIRRGVPLWAVAVGSALVALVLVTAIYLVITHTSTSAPTNTVASGSATGAPTAGSIAPPDGAGTPTVSVANVSAGPFTAARAAFSHAIDNAPPPAPAPTASITPSTPPSALPVSTAAAVTTTPPRVTTLAAAPAGRPHPAPAAEATGLLTVMCTPACDQVIDNGKFLGPSPIFRQKVAVGEHRVQLKSGRLLKTQSTIVTAGDLRSLAITMTP